MDSTLQMKLENNGLKIEVLNLRVQVAQLVMPQLEAERKVLLEEAEAAQKAAQAVADKGVLDAKGPPSLKAVE